MAATFLSRILGQVREIVLARAFGTQDDYAAYKAAFRIPDTLFLLIIGGALGSALIPVFSRFLGENEQAKAWRLANAVVNWAMGVLVLSCVLAWIFAPTIVTTVLAPGYAPATQELTINLTRLLLLQPLFIGLGGIAVALLNSNGLFFWPAFAPLFYNLSIIVGAVFLVGPFGIYGVVIGVIVGAILYPLIQIPSLLKIGFYWRPLLDRDAPGLGTVAKVLGPRLLGTAAFQANFFIATNLGSGLAQGANKVAAFEYAYQLFMLPHGIFALSLANVAFPTMARLLGEGNLAGMKRVVSGGLRQVVFLALPASVGLGLLARPIVRSLLQSGNFGNRDTELVSHALLFFSFGLVSYGLVEVLTRAFYALQDSLTPVVIALGVVALNLIFSLSLIGPLEQGGLALSLALSTTAEMILLGWLLRHKLHRLDDEGKLLPAVGKIMVATGAMALVLWVAIGLLRSPLESGGKLVVLALTLGLVGLGGGVYAAAAWLLRLEELRLIVRRFVRR